MGMSFIRVEIEDEKFRRKDLSPRQRQLTLKKKITNRSMILNDKTFANAYLLYLVLKYAGNLSVDSDRNEFKQVSDLVSYLKGTLEMKEEEISQSMYSQLNSNIENSLELGNCQLKLDIDDFLQSYSPQSIIYSKPTLPQDPISSNLDKQPKNPPLINSDLISTKNSPVNTTSSEQIKKSVKKPNLSKVNQKSTTSLLKRTRSESNGEESVDQSILSVNSQDVVSDNKIRKCGKRQSKGIQKKKKSSTPQSMQVMQFKFNRWMFHSVTSTNNKFQ